MRFLILLVFLFLLTGSTLAQVRLNEVGYLGVDFQGQPEWVELHNTGTGDVDVSGWFLCNFPVYQEIGNLMVLSGSMVIPAGGFLTVPFTALVSTTNGAEVGLYLNGNNFGSAANILDYMQYGSANHQRESVAVAAGVWQDNAFVAHAPSGQSLAFDDSDGTWKANTPTPGAVNFSSVATEDATLPTDFTLYSNYPNPFNPATTLRFALPAAATVAVTVLDALGRPVLSLPARPLAAGAHEVPVNAATWASGLYLYRVTATFGTRAQTRTGVMTLLK
jgi:hypothetical protein